MDRGPLTLALVATLIPMILSLAVGRPFLHFLKRINAGQRVRDDGPQRHLEKEGTPTMGGLMIVGTTTIGLLATMALLGGGRVELLVLPGLWLLIGTMTAFAAIGLADDWLKIKRGRSLGLRARYKLLWQLAVAALFVIVLALDKDHGYAVDWRLLGITALMPSVLGWVLLLVGTSNAMNLADGLDGLAAGLCVIAAAGLAYFSWSVAGDGTALIFGCSLVGACLGFLWFNAHPAQLFMGDVGSLGLGGALAAMAALLVNPLPLLGFCLVPFLEAASVVVQVISFKTTGKRVFKMSPIHHHFELSGWSEQQVVMRFWLVALVAAAVTVTLGMGR